MQVHLTLKSSNSKTGPIPVSTTEKASCPNNCPLKGNGCYANDYHLNMHWEKVSKKERGTDWDTFCQSVSKFKPNQLWRHNQAGDLPSNNGQTIDYYKLEQLIQANNGKRGFTYTHYPLNAFNRSLINLSNAQGFTINASTESLEQALNAFKQGIPSTVVLSDKYQGLKKFKFNEANVVICPAQVNDNITCQSCALCQKSNRDCIIGFIAHGSSKNKVIKIVKD